MKVLTIGTFDTFHKGHMDLFKECQTLTQGTAKIVIGVNTDEFVATFKPRTWVPYDSRAASCEAYGIVVPHSGNTEKFIRTHNPRYLVIGSDWARKDYYAQLGVDHQFFDDHGIVLVYVPRTRVLSSTQIKATVSG